MSEHLTAEQRAEKITADCRCIELHRKDEIAALTAEIAAVKAIAEAKP